MKALIYSAYYEPEVAASLYLSTDLYEDIANSGIEVTLYVPIPTRGVSKEERKIYSTKKKFEEQCDGKFHIKRVMLPREGKNSIKRAIRYILMNVIFVFKSISENPDFIFVQSTPPTQGAMAAVIKKAKKIPLIYNLQDIFPDSLVGSGMTKKGSFIFKAGRIIENFTYRNCDSIIVISNDMKNNIIEKGVPQKKITVVNNWVDSSIIHPIEKENNYLYEKYKINPNKFTVVYAGNLGYAQNINIILQAAKLLEDHENIQFLIFGKGNQETEYKREAMTLNLTNLSFFPIQPYSEVSYVYSLADASVVPCKKGFGGSAMPSKIWSIMATGTPVLASFDRETELENMILKEKVGLFSDADNVNALVCNILKLVGNSELKKNMGLNARKYVIDNLARKICTDKYINVIQKVVSEKRRKM